MYATHNQTIVFLFSHTSMEHIVKPVFLNYIYGKLNKTHACRPTSMEKTWKRMLLGLHLWTKNKTMFCFTYMYEKDVLFLFHIYGKQLETHVWGCTSMENTIKPRVLTYNNGRKTRQRLFDLPLHRWNTQKHYVFVWHWCMQNIVKLCVADLHLWKTHWNYFSCFAYIDGK